MFHTLNDSCNTVIVIVIARKVQVIEEIGTEHIGNSVVIIALGITIIIAVLDLNTQKFTYQLYSQYTRAQRPGQWCLSMYQEDRTAILGP